MAGESPASVVVDGVNGIEIAVVDASAIPALTRALLVAGKDALGNARVLLVGADGSLAIAPTAAAVSTVGRSAATVTLAVANANRKGLIVQNDIVAGRMFLKLGTGATTVDFSVEMFPKATFELPFPVYTGNVTATWNAAGAGQARVTEME